MNKILLSVVALICFITKPSAPSHFLANLLKPFDPNAPKSPKCYINIASRVIYRNRIGVSVGAKIEFDFVTDNGAHNINEEILDGATDDTTEEIHNGKLHYFTVKTLYGRFCLKSLTITCVGPFNSIDYDGRDKKIVLNHLSFPRNAQCNMILGERNYDSTCVRFGPDLMNVNSFHVSNQIFVFCDESNYECHRRYIRSVNINGC